MSNAKMKIILIYIVTTIAAAQHNNSSATQWETLKGEECFRDCNEAMPKICYFQWSLEHYSVMGPACGKCGESMNGDEDCYNKQCVTADGFERGIMTINRQIPGPDIQVCKDDLIVVDVSNKMGGTSTTIHWHGLHMRKTPHYDGVPFITQCPILFATTFRYVFEASETGTQFYHSHSGHHRLNGIAGGLVVRDKSQNYVNLDTYDRDEKEHLMIANDWMEIFGEMLMPGLKTFTHGLRPHSFLINGKGKRFNKTTRRPTTATPLEVFRVVRGQRYRFRFINSMSHVCPALLEIEKHSMLIIATDGFDVQPASVDSFVSQAGERYDFVINANQIGDHFLIRLKGLAFCEELELQQFAVLSYVADSSVKDNLEVAFPKGTFPDYWISFGNGPSLNHPNTSCNIEDTKDLCITHLSSYNEHPDITDVEPDHRFYLGFENVLLTTDEIFGTEDYEHFINLSDEDLDTGAINNISFLYPHFSLLTQPTLVKDDVFCDRDNLPKRCRNKKVCYCVHRLKVEMNSIVELIAVDEIPHIIDVNHPFHLHGYKLHIMGMGQHPEGIPMTIELAKSMMMLKTLPLLSGRKFVNKDTISIPSKGYAVFRFKADNPGWWFLHCHFEYHTESGMGLVLQVGETCQMVKPPKDFPTCHSFKPLVDSSRFSN